MGTRLVGGEGVYWQHECTHSFDQNGFIVLVHFLKTRCIHFLYKNEIIHTA